MGRYKGYIHNYVQYVRPTLCVHVCVSVTLHLTSRRGVGIGGGYGGQGPPFLLFVCTLSSMPEGECCRDHFYANVTYVRTRSLAGGRRGTACAVRRGFAL